MEKLKTVVLDANRADPLSVGVDTILRGVLRLPERLFTSPAINRSRLLRRVIGQRYDALSYMGDWREAFLRSPQLDAVIVNITNLVEYRAARKRIRNADLIIVLHSATGDDLRLLLRTAHWFHGRRGKMCVFVGNEYDLMADKKRFIDACGADFVCTQLPVEAGEWLYSDCSAARVIPMPHALNPDVYRDLGRTRTVDVGFVGDLYDRTIGDDERTRLIRYFEERPSHDGLRTAIRVNRRLPRDDWNAFLNDCHSIIGAESGSYYLQKDGRAIECAKAYQKRHPAATFEEVFEACFRNADHFRSGKAISSRHFEPIGARTCQILVEGHYSGILSAGEHYIPVRRDLSDVEEALALSRDAAARNAVVQRAYDHVMSAHTYAHRVADLVRLAAP